MSDYVSKLKADTSQHDKALEDSAKKVSNYKKETDQASASVNKMTQSTSRSTSELMKEMSSMENLGRSTSNYKKQLGSLQKQIVDLTVNYRNMSDEQKRSATGVEVAARIDELKQKAAEYKDAIMDVNMEIKNMASDTAGWDGIKQGIDIVSSSMQTFVSITGLSEKESAKLLQVMNKVKLAEQAANTVIKIGNALQKNSAVMTGLKTLATKADTTATNLQTGATVKATGAQAEFNVVANANPYVLLATAVITVVTALVAFSKKTSEATQAQKEQNESLKELDKNYKNSYINTLADLTTKYKLLQIQFKALKTDAERTQWIEDNKNAFDELGISVNNLNDAWKTFVDDNPDVIQAFVDRANAAALQSKLNEVSKKALEERDRLDSEQAYVGGQTLSAAQAKDIPISYLQAKYQNTPAYMQEYTLSDEGAKKLNEKREEYYNELINQEKDIAEKLAELQKPFASKGSGNGGDEDKPEAGSLNDLKDKLAALEKSRVTLNLSDDALAKLNKQIDDLQNQISDKEIALGIKIDPKKAEEEAAAKKYVEDLQKAVNTASKTLSGSSQATADMIEPVRMFDSTLETVEDTFRDNNKLLENYNDTLIQITHSITTLKNAQDELNKAGGPDQEKWTEEAKATYAELEKRISDLTAQYQATIDMAGKLTQKQNELNVMIAKQNKLVANNDIYGGIKNIWGATNDWASSLVDISQKWDELNDGEKFTTIIDSIFSTIDAFKSLSETISLIDNAFKVLGITEQTLSSIEQSTTQQHMSNELQKQSADTNTIGLETMKGTVTAVANGTQAGWPAMLIAIPIALAAVISAIATAKSVKAYASGGIISGPTSLGDYNIARVNNGEMILNGSQQAKLFRLANEGQLNQTNQNNKGQVEFKIRGQELVGILKNYNSKLSRV